MTTLERPRHPAVQQMLLLGGLLVAAPIVFWLLAGPPHGTWEDFWSLAWLPAVIAIALWGTFNAFMAVHRWTSAHPAPPTALGNTTFWVGIVSAVFVCTGPLLGWLAVLIAPIGIVTGLIALTLELRRREGHNGRNAIGLGLAIAALLVAVIVNLL